VINESASAVPQREARRHIAPAPTDSHRCNSQRAARVYLRQNLGRSDRWSGEAVNLEIAVQPSNRWVVDSAA
jgi:hypothetical protein